VFNVEIFPNDIYFLDRMPSEINPVSIVIIFILALITTVLASLIPAMAISKMDPIKALKYE
jgi:lipoprotein-releasing system permease protein